MSRLGLHANITIVDSHLVALDAQQQLLMLADGSSLPYDLLALATGLQVGGGTVGWHHPHATTHHMCLMQSNVWCNSDMPCVTPHHSAWHC